MTPRRFSDHEEGGDSIETTYVAETMRNKNSAHHQPPEKHGDEKISLFWRIFGGTILSIVALVVITAYQSISNSITDLRGSIAHVNEAKAELVKKDEYAAGRQRTWDKITEIQKEAAGANSRAQQALTSLQEKSTLRDQQLKQMEDERKELLKEVASLRERLARVEATKAPAKTTKQNPDDGN
jgi:hypothetical protein